jgi:hypothetical protein
MDIFVLNFGEYHGLLNQLKPRILVSFMTAAHLGSQAFYMERAYVLSGRRRVLLLFFGAAWYVECPAKTDHDEAIEPSGCC